jgi:dTDP-4-dehydrorhamnose reductase
MRILVTGASGLLGLNFALQFGGQAGPHTIIGTANQNSLADAPFELLQVDLARPGTAHRLVAQVKPDLVLHCAAIANLEISEANPHLAERLNGEVPGEFAAATAQAGIPLVHISTDAVFDGLSGDYSELDIPNPINNYARTKLAGEQAVARHNSRAIIARVNFYGWSLSGKRSLGEFFFNHLKAGSPAKGFTDIIFCSLQVNILGQILLDMVAGGLSGLYHVLSSECLSKYEFGCRIANQFGFDPHLVRPVSWVEAGLTAPRSPNLNLRTDKLANALGRLLPMQAPGLEKFEQEYRAGLAGRIHQMVTPSIQKYPTD